MVDKGISLNEVTYNTIINSLVKHGAITEAHNFVEVMVRGGLKLDIITYSTYCMDIHLRDDLVSYVAYLNL